MNVKLKCWDELNTYTYTHLDKFEHHTAFSWGKRVKQLIIYARISLLIAWMIHVADVPSVKKRIGL
jgi:hypothetical protein